MLDFAIVPAIGCGLQRALIPTKGQLIVSPKYIGFYRHALAGRDVKLRFKIEDVKSATKVRCASLKRLLVRFADNLMPHRRHQRCT